MFVAGSKFNSQVHHFFSLTNEWRQRWIRIFVSKSLKNIKVAMRRDFLLQKRCFEPMGSFKILISWETDELNCIEKSGKYHSFDAKRWKSEGCFEKQEKFYFLGKWYFSTVRKTYECQWEYFYKWYFSTIRNSNQ